KGRRERNLTLLLAVLERSDDQCKKSSVSATALRQERGSFSREVSQMQAIRRVGPTEIMAWRTLDCPRKGDGPRSRVEFRGVQVCRFRSVSFVIERAVSRKTQRVDRIYVAFDLDGRFQRLSQGHSN